MPESERSLELRQKLGEMAVAKSQAWLKWNTLHERASYVADHIAEDPALALELAEIDPARESALHAYKVLVVAYKDLAAQLRRLHDRESEMERRRVKAEQAEIDRRWRESHPPIR